MLLRSSRVAEQLTKEALLGRLALGAGKKALSFAGKNPGKLLGTGLVAATAGPEIMKGVQQSKVGLNNDYLQASNAGLVPSVPKF